MLANLFSTSFTYNGTINYLKRFRFTVYERKCTVFVAASKQIEHIHDVALRRVKVSVILIE